MCHENELFSLIYKRRVTGLDKSTTRSGSRPGSPIWLMPGIEHRRSCKSLSTHVWVTPCGRVWPGFWQHRLCLWACVHPCMHLQCVGVHDGAFDGCQAHMCVCQGGWWDGWQVLNVWCRETGHLTVFSAAAGIVQMSVFLWNCTSPENFKCHLTGMYWYCICFIFFELELESDF